MCKDSSEPPAAFLRAVILLSLHKQGALDSWVREDGAIPPKVIEGAATLPLPDGETAFHPQDFIEALNAS